MAYSGFPDHTVDTSIIEARSAINGTARSPILDICTCAINKVIDSEDVWYYKGGIIDDLSAIVASSYTSEVEVRLYSASIRGSLSFRAPNNSIYTEPSILSIFRTVLHNCGFRSSPPKAW